MAQDLIPHQPQASAEEAILKLTADLRKMDQLVFNMSQCDSWGRMRPIFVELLALTQSRMKAESDRIRGLMIPEIVRTYLEHK